MEAQRYPNDYDGIVSGAPVNRFTHLHIGQLWTAHATLKTPGAALTRDDLALVSGRVLAQCDALDGVTDGVLNDPRRCAFDPNVLQCGSGQQADACLAPAKVRALEMIYEGAVNPRTGVSIYPGLEPGSEGPQPNNPGWALIMNGQRPFAIDLAVLGMVYEDPSYDWRTFDFDHDVETVDAKLYGTLNAIDPDLRDFKSAGGKLIVYHGWNDPGVMPQQTVDYFESVVGFASRISGGDGVEYTDEYMRLFMMPGVGHCRGGTGPDQADFMSALTAWVEDGVAPERIEARQVVDGAVTTTRPLCPYPLVARYRGRGDADSADSFVCASPE
jgi:feruloyl esterase